MWMLILLFAGIAGIMGLALLFGIILYVFVFSIVFSSLIIYLIITLTDSKKERD